MKNDDVRTHHDEWIKEALWLWLTGLGEVVADARIAGRSRRGDVLYTERHDDPALRGRLGALGEIARGKVLFEVFRNPPSDLEFKTCVVKLVELEAAEARSARRDERQLSTRVVPTMCAVVPSMSREFACTMGIADGERGLRALLGAGWHTVVVVANELPEDDSTMWLRLLGRGKVQAATVHQLLETSKQEPLRDATLKLLAEWRQSLPPADDLSEDVRELAMNLGQSFESWEMETLARGVAAGEAAGKAAGEAAGKAAGKAEAVLAVLEGRGLTVTAAQHRQVLACTDLAQLDAWARAAGTAPSTSALLSGGAPPRRVKRSG